MASSNISMILACCIDRPGGNTQYYIGLKKNESTANAANYWLDGSNSTFRVYKSGEPDQSYMCFVIKADPDVEMEDRDCATSNYFICKTTEGTC